MTSSTTQAIAGLSAVDITSVVSEMVVAMASKDTDNPKVVAALRAKVAALPFWATLPAAGRDNLKQRVLLDPALRIVVNNRDVNSVWWIEAPDMGDGRRFNDFVLLQSQGVWFSYSFTTRATTGLQLPVPHAEGMVRRGLHLVLRPRSTAGGV